MWASIWPYLAAILPTIGVAILFYFLIKNMMEGDRKERLAQSKWEAEQDRIRGVGGARRASDKGTSEATSAAGNDESR